MMEIARSVILFVLFMVATISFTYAMFIIADADPEDDPGDLIEEFWEDIDE